MLFNRKLFIVNFHTKRHSRLNNIAVMRAEGKLGNKEPLPRSCPLLLVHVPFPYTCAYKFQEKHGTVVHRMLKMMLEIHLGRYWPLMLATT